MSLTLKLNNPFPGLSAYDDQDATVYPGIEWQKNSFLKNISESNFVVVVGNNGVGKTSFIHSEILPELKSGFIINGKMHWKMAQLRPGRDPIGSLASAMAGLEKSSAGEHEKVDPNLAQQFETILRRSKFGIIEIIEKFRFSEDANVLFFIDQLDDVVFNSTSDSRSAVQNDTKLFVDRLVEVINQSAYSIKVIATLRTERVGFFAAFPRLAEAINKNQFLLSTIDRRDILAVFRKIVETGELGVDSDLIKRVDDYYRTHPLILAKFQHAMKRCVDKLNEQKILNLLSEVGMRFTRYPHLVEIISGSQLLKDLLRQNDNLAYLNKNSKDGEFTFDVDITDHFYDHEKSTDLMQQEFQALMKHVEPKSLDWSYVEKVGGLDDSITDQLESIFENLNEAQKETCRLLFQSITGIVNTKPVAIHRTIREIAELTDKTEEEIIDVVKNFSDSSCGAIRVYSSGDIHGKLEQLNFILDQSDNKVSIFSEISITQDIILELWPRLLQWIKEERDNAGIYTDILKDVATKQPYYEGEKLRTIWKWYEQSKPNRGWAQRYRSTYEVGFELAEEFLLNSKRLYDREIMILQDEERSRSAKAARNAKIFWAGVIITIALISLDVFYSYKAIEATSAATEARREAKKESENAAYEKANARAAQMQAAIASKEAIRSRLISKQEQDSARVAKEEAQIQLLKAQKSQAEQRIAEEKAKVFKKELEQSEKLIKASNLELEYLKLLARINKLSESAEQLIDTHLEEEKKIAANLASIAYASLMQLSQDPRFDSSIFKVSDYAKLKSNYRSTEKKLIADIATVCQNLESPAKKQLSKIRYGTALDRHPNLSLNRFVVGTDQNKIWRIDLAPSDKNSLLRVNVMEDVKVPGSLVSGIRSIKYSASGRNLYTGTVEGLVRANNDSTRLNKKRDNIIAIFAVKADEIITVDRAGLIEFYQNNFVMGSINIGNQLVAVDYSAKGNYLLMNGPGPGELVRVDVTTGARGVDFSKRIVKVNFAGGQLTALKIINNRNWVAVGTVEGNLIIFDQGKGKMVFMDDNEHFASISSLAVQEQSQLLVSGGTDNLINVWQLNEIDEEIKLVKQDYEPIVFKELQPIQDLHFADNGWFLAVSRGQADESIDRSASGRVSIWSINLNQLNRWLEELKGSWYIPDFKTKYYKYIPD